MQLEVALGEIRFAWNLSFASATLEELLEAPLQEERNGELKALRWRAIGIARTAFDVA